MNTEVADIGLIGLAVMGQNLILNMNDHGFKVCAYNRTTEKVKSFIENEAKGTQIIGAFSLEEMVRTLKKPKRVMLLVKAGSAVDEFINKLVPHLSSGDIIIDGGNSDYHDTTRRVVELEKKGILFVGSGVSGGEEGARYGPSLMPGGNPRAWPHIKNIFQAISAKADGEPCCDWVGETGAGHFVKMVHNGIEYGDMQLICEAYHIMRDGLGLNPEEMSNVFDEWNKGDLKSFLIEITRDILRYKNDKGYLLERIRDTAGQKGTGKWTVNAALEYGVPVTLIANSVFARFMSALKNHRVEASKIHKKNIKPFSGDKKQALEHLRKALYAAKIISYAQGFMLLKQAAQEHNWNLNYGGIALMWRGGCIIRSAFLGNIKQAFDKNPNLSDLLLDDFFIKVMHDCQDSLIATLQMALQQRISTPTFSSARDYYDGITCNLSPANLLQAMRDYFGAHTYELMGQEGKFVHTNWTGRGGNVSASTYDA
ncbi:6-phosphogluconate dehydrogenase, decarboxylating [Chelonus insularis]|uniref:6-phosphogluconate dehydrogenase, decarboxylating n=1 Tax=Chelonus insularis TaxID=460826 RepID=UPI00158EFC65|nr:6-phosphogluconate dehydrogenase, decarboxylating [Chelonus insularis]